MLVRGDRRQRHIASGREDSLGAPVAEQVSRRRERILGGGEAERGDEGEKGREGEELHGEQQPR